MSQPSNTNIQQSVSSDKELIDYRFNFFVASTTKLILMSICTFGLYNLFWFYKNWLVLKNAGKKCWPFWRAFFAPIFALSCFWYIRKSLMENNVRAVCPVTTLTISYLILQFSGRSPEPYCLLALLSFLPIVIANRAAIKVNQVHSAGFDKNNKFSIWNWLVLLLGSVLVILAIIGTFIPDAQGVN